MSALAAPGVRETNLALDTVLLTVVQSADRDRSIGEETLQAVAGSRASAGRLLEAMERIGHVVEMIRGITEQTKPLPFNGMIDVACIGQAEADFPVVGHEVQASARQGHGAGSIVGRMRNTQTAVRETAAAIDSVVIAFGSKTVDAVEVIEREADPAGTIAADIGSVSGLTDTVSRFLAGVPTAVDEAREKSEPVGQEAEDVPCQVRHTGSRLSAHLTSARAA